MFVAQLRARQGCRGCVVCDAATDEARAVGGVVAVKFVVPGWDRSLASEQLVVFPVPCIRAAVLATRCSSPKGQFLAYPRKAPAVLRQNHAFGLSRNFGADSGPRRLVFVFIDPR